MNAFTSKTSYCNLKYISTFIFNMKQNLVENKRKTIFFFFKYETCRFLCILPGHELI